MPTSNTITRIATISVFLFTIFLLGTPSAHAQTVELIVDGGAIASIDNGESVLLEWYIDGAILSCTINNGVGPIDTSILPTTGSLLVIPPDNESTTYTLTCTGGSSSVTIYINPAITLTTSPAGPVVYNPLIGTAEFMVEWESRYTTQCTKVWWTTASNPGVQQWTTDANNPDRGNTEGEVTFGTGLQGPITETITLSIQCSNVVTGEQSTQSITLVVDDSVPPPAPSVDLWSVEGETVVPDPILGWAYVDQLSYTTQGVTSCTRQAYYLDNSPYASLPQGYVQIGWEWGGVTNFNDVRILESTRFEVTCTQPAYTFSGVDYPATQVSDSVTITVSPAVSFDRSAVPPITLTLTPVETTVFTNPLTGYGLAVVQVTVENAERCSYSASGHADGWWGQSGSGDKDSLEFANLYAEDTPETYTLYARCFRDFDRELFAPGSPEYAGGEVTASIEITVEPGTAVIPPLRTYMYGNATWVSASQLNNFSHLMSGFQLNSGVSGGYLGGVYDALRSPSSAENIDTPTATDGAVTFPFNAFHSGTGGDYDIFVAYCDENDGFNDFTLTTESGFTTTWRSDEQTHDTWCNRDNTTKVKRVGVGVPLIDGELVTISCNNTADPLKLEQCILIGVGFGQGDGGSLSATQDISTGFAPATVMWMGENADRCYDAIATVDGGVNYSFSSATDIFRRVSTDISANTEFSIVCERTRNGTETDSSSVTIVVGGEEIIVADAVVQTGECNDPDTGVLRQAVPGERAGAGGVCEPGVDLSALTPAMSFASAVADAVNGIYDSIDALVVIQNLGPYALPAGGSIPYQATLNLNETIATAFGVTANRVSLSAPAFSSEIPIPNMVAGVATPPTESPTLTRTFDGVPFGTHQLCARVNLDDADSLVYGEWNISPLNNQVCAAVTLPVPPPPMTLTTNRDAVRARQPVTISWSLNVTYDMTCTMRGPGGLNQSFSTSPGSNPYSGSFTTQELRSTSRFQLQCTEPLTNTVFTEEIVVEYIPRPFEV